MAATRQLSVRSLYLPVNGNPVSPNELRYLWNQVKDFKRVRIAKISSKQQADDHDDESDTSTLVGGEDIDEKTKAVVKK